jgi:hypothetical protein
MLDDCIICGYQGWYGFPGDCATINRWMHWLRVNDTAPSYENAHFDMYLIMIHYIPQDGGFFSWRRACTYITNSNNTTIWCAQFMRLTKALRSSRLQQRRVTFQFRRVVGWHWMQTVTLYPRIGIIVWLVKRNWCWRDAFRWKVESQ